MKLLQLSALSLVLAMGSAWAASGAKSHPATKSPSTKSAAVGQVWDWSKIDTNKDHLVEPAEMEAWLKANPGVQKGG